MSKDERDDEIEMLRHEVASLLLHCMAMRGALHRFIDGQWDVFERGPNPTSPLGVAKTVLVAYDGYITQRANER